MEALVKTRTLLRSRLIKLQATINKNNTEPISERGIAVLLEGVTDIESKVNAIQDDMVLLCNNDAELTAQTELSDWYQAKFFELKDKLYKIQETFVIPKQPEVLQNPQPKQDSSLVKLPRVDLPTFDGRFEGWQSFQDLFIATVDRNQSLSGAQKLQYLKCCVKGEAANIIKSFTITDPNYREAWGLLTDRYDNKREIVHSILNRLFSQPAVKSESSSSLQALLDTTMECLRSLKVLERPVDSWDDVIVFFVVSRMDQESRKEWAKVHKGTEPPTFKELTEFMEQQIRSLHTIGIMSKTNSKGESRSSHSHGGDRRQASSHHSSSEELCPVCKSNHPLYQCSKFKDMTLADRSSVVKRAAVCYSCLCAGHNVRDCKSNRACRKCGKGHNTLLHFERSYRKQYTPVSSSTRTSHSDPVGSLPSSNPQGGLTPNETTTHFGVSNKETSQVLLSTALVHVHDYADQKKLCRSLLDDGSEVSFISESCAKALGLNRHKVNITVSGISTSLACVAKSRVNFKLSSLVNDMSLEVEALVVPKVTGNLPKFSMDRNSWSHISGLQLADPDFDKSSAIDLLLGAEVVAAVKTDGLRVGPTQTPVAQNSLLGWALSGRVATAAAGPRVNVHHANLDELLCKFWELEQVPDSKHLTKEEKLCEEHFMKTHSRQIDGRFVVKLPFNNKVANLGSSREQSVHRLKQVERRLALNPDHKKDYIKFMREYQSLGHMEKVPPHLLNKEAVFYLPHHCVFKLDSTTTKMRVVFDGSARTSTGVSLNNALMVGPTIQDDLFDLLLRFRCHVVALKADIKKMYRQFNIHEEDVDYQRIVWRESMDEPIQDYRLLTVTYGTASAPYLATRCLKQLATDEEENFPLAAKALAEDMYVDDLMGGASSTESAISLREEISDLATKGGMEIVKWATNDPAVLESIPLELREAQEELSFDVDSAVKALGVKWKPYPDLYSFSVNPPECEKTITKRSLLSELAKVFDPLGLLSPTTIRAKLIFQNLWKEKCSWDDVLTDDIQSQWKSYQEEMHLIESIRIPRPIIIPNPVQQQFCGFCDASEKAYAAAVYLRSERGDGSFNVTLIASKTKVAPIKQVSLPRLELCGALLLCDLMGAVIKSSKLQGSVTAWTDSTIVLSWLSSFPGRWKTFVANRVAKIQDTIPVENWRHVRSEDNPADLPSRGISAEELSESSLWWNGPEWLQQPVFPVSSCDPDLKTVVSEEKSVTVMTAQVSIEPSLLSKYSSIRTLTRVTAYCFRFTSNCKTQKSDRQIGDLTVQELNFALHQWIKVTQSEEFSVEMDSLNSSKAIPHNSKLRQLNPFVDSLGILRVGGRLQKATVPEGVKHPIVLPSNHPLTKLIIRKCHFQTLHGGLSLVLSTLLQDYWILRARDSVRHIIRKCVVCRRNRAALSMQLMGSLPSARVNPSRPFQQCGVDYAGPYNIRHSKGRGRTTFKCYFSVFVCLSTKAIHLEAVTELSTEGFLACFKRFVSRRGVPCEVYSDCGTNFVGADKELQIMLHSTNHNAKVSQYTADKGTNWNFNPPSAPHQGGLWEAGVKSVKFHLCRVMGNATLTLEEFQTILCQVEACLNSRPLCAISSDPNDLDVLTPGHFLIGCPLNSVPEPDLTNVKVNRLSKWQQSQQLFQHFWKRWSSEYLTSLQQRFKWTQKRPNLTVNDLVIIKDDNLPPMKWKLGRIIDVHPGADSCVRVVTVKTNVGEFKRPIAKLCPLISNNELE